MAYIQVGRAIARRCLHFSPHPIPSEPTGRPQAYPATSTSAVSIHSFPFSVKHYCISILWLSCTFLLASSLCLRMLYHSCSTTQRALKLKVREATFHPKLYLIIGSIEQRHEKYVSKVAQMVQLDNSLGVIDPIFGLLVSPAALQGRGNVHDVECLQVHNPFPF